MTIVIEGTTPAQQEAVVQSWLELEIVRKKQRSPIEYVYPSLDALAFELRTRSNITEAARGLNGSGATFAVFEESRCNPLFWTRQPNGGFLLNPGVTPAQGIQNIFMQGYLYAFECATAIVIVLYKAILDTIGPARFNYYFSNLLLYDWQYDSDLRLIETFNLAEAYPGDVLYFRNPGVNPLTPQWQGENTIKMAEDLYYGHGIGIRPAAQIIAMLNTLRAPWSTESAYLTNQVVQLDFNYVRTVLAARQPGIVARIGSGRRIIVPVEQLGQLEQPGSA